MLAPATEMRTTFDALGAILPQLGADAPHEADDEAVRRRYRTVFISDLHLGTPGCQATALLQFLKAHPSDYLYLVGDIAFSAPFQPTTRPSTVNMLCVT